MKGTYATDLGLEPDSTILPADPRDLDPDDYRLVADSCLGTWPDLSDRQRQSILEKLRRVDARDKAVRARRDDRSAKCSAYVDALCHLPRKGTPEYDAAWLDMLDKKAAYLAVKSHR